MSIGHPIPEIRLFQNLTLKIQGQGHRWGESWKSQHGSNILSTHIPFIPCQSAIPFLIWLFRKLTLKIQGQGNGLGQSWKSQSVFIILSTHIPFVPCQSALPFLRYSIFKDWPWKSKVKVIGEGKVESHNMDPTFYRLTSLFNSMSIGHPIPEIWLFQNLTLKIQGQGHSWGQSWKSQSGCNILSTYIAFFPCQSALTFLRYSIFKGQGHGWGGHWKSQHGSNILSTHIPLSIGHPIPEIWLF